MNLQTIKNHRTAMNKLKEQEFYTKTNFRKLTNDMTETAEKIRQDRTVEQAVKESGIDYQIDGDHILIGKSLENYDQVKEGELERAIEDEAEQYAADRENEYFKYGGC